MEIVWLDNLPHLVSQFFNNTQTCTPLFQRILVVVVRRVLGMHLTFTRTYGGEEGNINTLSSLSLTLDLVSISTLCRPSETTELTFQVSCRAAVADAHRDLSQVPKLCPSFVCPKRRFVVKFAARRCGKPPGLAVNDEDSRSDPLWT